MYMYKEIVSTIGGLIVIGEVLSSFAYKQPINKLVLGAGIACLVGGMLMPD